MEDGNMRYAHVSGEPVYDSNGTFRGYRGIGRDISARRRMELELAQSRQFLSDVIDFIPLPLVVKDETGRMIIVNSAMEKFQKRPAAELTGRRDDEVFPGDRARLLHAEDEAVLRTGTPLTEEQTFVTAAGESRWVIKHKQRIVPGDGRRLVIATLMDITARKEAELELARNQEFLDAILEAIPQPMFVKDSHHRWVLFNSAFCDLLGRDRAELLNRSDPDVYSAEWVAKVSGGRRPGAHRQRIGDRRGSQRAERRRQHPLDAQEQEAGHPPRRQHLHRRHFGEHQPTEAGGGSAAHQRDSAPPDGGQLQRPDLPAHARGQRSNTPPRPATRCSGTGRTSWWAVWSLRSSTRTTQNSRCRSSRTWSRHRCPSYSPAA